VEGPNSAVAAPRAPEAHGVRRNTLAAAAAQAVTSAFTAFLTYYLVRSLGASGYGVFALAVGVGTVVLLPSDFGLPAAVARFVAERRESPLKAAGVLLRGVQLKLIGATVGSVGLWIASVPVADIYGNPRLKWPLRWMALSIFGQGVVGFFIANFAAMRRVTTSLKLISAESALETAATVTLVALGTGAAGAALGRAIGYLLGGVVGFVLATRLIGPIRTAWSRRREVTTRTLARYAGAMMTVDAAHILIVQVDILFVGSLLGTTRAGQFGAVTRLYVFLAYMGIAVAAGVAPRLARSERAEPDTRSYLRGLRYLILFQGMLIAPLTVWAKPVVDLLLGPGYGGSVGVMRALAPTVLLAAVAPVLSLGVNYLGEARRRVPIMACLLVLAVPLTYVLIKAIGFTGAALADDLVILLEVVAHAWLCWRVAGIDVRPLYVPLLRMLMAALVMCGVFAAFGTDKLSALAWVLGGAGGLLAYAVTLLATRAVSLSEIRALAADARARVPRRSSQRHPGT
jgi:O-antigen/teichoic acid export membrane protein